MLLNEMIEKMDMNDSNIVVALTTYFPIVGLGCRMVVDIPITKWEEFECAYSPVFDRMEVENIEVYHHFGDGKKIRFGVICDYPELMEEEVQSFFEEHGEEAF